MDIAANAILNTIRQADPGSAELMDALGVVFLGEWLGTDDGLAAAADAILDQREADWIEREWRRSHRLQAWRGPMEPSEERAVA